MQKNKVLTKIGICLIMTLQFTQGIVTPGLAAMQAAFSDSPTELVQYLATIAQLFCIISIFFGSFADKFGYKKMTIATVAIMFIGAIGCALIGNASFWGVFVCRVIYGIGYGFAFSLSIAFVGVLYEGQERSSMLGIMIGVGGVAAIIFSYVAGVLSAINWVYLFWFQAIYILVVGAIGYVLVPEPSKVEGSPAWARVQGTAAPQSSASGPASSKKKWTFPGSFWVLLIGAMFGIAAFSTFMNNAAMVIVGTGMGDGNQIGIVFSIFAIGMAVGSFAYAPVLKLLHRFVHPFILILFSISFIGFLTVTSVGVMMVFAAIFGFAFGMLNPCWTDRLMSKAGGNEANVSSLFVATQGVAQFASPGIGIIAGLFGLTGLYYQWQLCMPCIAVVALIVLIMNIVSVFKKPSNVAE